MRDGGLGGHRLRCAALARFGRLHFERVVEAVEVVEEADGAEQLDDLALGVEAAQLGKLLVGYGVSIARDGFGEAQRSLFGRGEVVAAGPVGEVRELIVGPAEVAGEDGVAGQAIGRLIDLAGTNDDQLLQPGGNRAGIQDGGKMRLHGGKDIGPVGHYSKHVGHVAAQGKGLVIEGGDIGRHFAAVKAGNPGHCASFWFFLMVPFLTLFGSGSGMGT